MSRKTNKSLEVIKALEKANPNPDKSKHRILEPITVGEYHILISANQTAKCHPQGILALHNYEEFQIGLFKGQDLTPVFVQRNAMISKYARKIEFKGYFEGHSAQFMPVNVLNDFYKYLAGTIKPVQNKLNLEEDDISIFEELGINTPEPVKNNSKITLFETGYICGVFDRNASMGVSKQDTTSKTGLGWKYTPRIEIGTKDLPLAKELSRILEKADISHSVRLKGKSKEKRGFKEHPSWIVSIGSWAHVLDFCNVFKDHFTIKIEDIRVLHLFVSNFRHTPHGKPQMYNPVMHKAFLRLKEIIKERLKSNERERELGSKERAKKQEQREKIRKLRQAKK